MSGYAHVRNGSIASVWPSVADFRSSPGSGHRHGRSACLKRAMNRHQATNSDGSFTPMENADHSGSPALRSPSK